MIFFRQFIRLAATIILPFYIAACVTTTSLQVTPATEKALRTADFLVLRTQEKIYVSNTTQTVPVPAYSSAPNAGASGEMVAVLLLSGLVGGIAYGSIMERRKKEVEQHYSLIQANIDDVDIEDGVKRVIEANFNNLEWFQSPEITVVDGAQSDAIEHAIATSTADAVAVVSPHYQFSQDFSAVAITLRYAMYPVSDSVRQSVGANSDSAKPFSQTEHSWVVGIPSSGRGSVATNVIYWSDNEGKNIKAALHEAIQFTTAKLHLALTSGASDVTARTIATKEPGTGVDGIFPSVAARNNSYRAQIETAALTWPPNYQEILANCDASPELSTCLNLKAAAAETLRGQIARLSNECSSASVETSQDKETGVASACAPSTEEQSSVLMATAPPVAVEKQVVVNAEPVRQAYVPVKFRTPGFKKLDGREIKALYRDMDSVEHFTLPGHYSSFPWTLSFLASGEWRGENRSRGSDSAGVWRVEDGKLCIELTEGLGLQEQLEAGCYPIHVDWQNATIALDAPNRKTGLYVVKQFATSDLMRLAALDKPQPSQLAETRPSALAAPQSSALGTPETSVRTTPRQSQEVTFQTPGIPERNLLTPQAPEKSNGSGYHKLNGQEIKALFSGLDSAHYRSRNGSYNSYPWNISFRADGLWSAILPRGKESWGKWHASNNQLCIDVKHYDATNYPPINGCFDTHIDRQKGLIAIDLRQVQTDMFVVKENAAFEISRLAQANP